MPKTYTNTIPYRLRKPDGLSAARIRAVYPKTGEIRLQILAGELTGWRHSLRLVRCGCGQPLLARWQKRKVRGYLSLPTAKLYHGDTPTCEACSTNRRNYERIALSEPSVN